MTSAIEKNADPYKSSSFIGISLWMCPIGAAGEAYTKIIQEAAEEYGTFDFKVPHVTLVAALLSDNVVERARELATRMTPYEFESDGISGRDAYFQSVYSKMKLSPEAIRNNAIAQEFFEEECRTNPPYVPHLSLVYGDLDANQKEEFKLKILQNKTTLPSKFMVDAIQVWCTKGEVETWYCIEKIPLTGKKI
mmetsp:Transcript_33490/g.38137  ORF Transcript_33490/g.38137 Transcript_33490/m.38137 type:complete len:193 (+) Transcript_33490:45-623(+)